MNKTYFKNILKDIKNTKGKVASIAIMVGLAALVVVALTLTGPSMRNTLAKSLETYDHADMIVKSTYGLDYEDELILKKDSDIEKMTLVKTADLMEGENLIRLKSYHKDIKKSLVVQGRMPEKTGEVALDIGLSKNKKIGDELSFSYIENARVDAKVMKSMTYKVVGFFKSSDYFMEDMRELSFTAKKEIDGYGFILEDDFDTDKFGEINIVYKDSRDMDRTSDEYLAYVDKKQKEIEDAFANRPGEVLDDIRKDSNKDLDDAQKDIDDAKEQISDAEKKLQDGRKDLDQANIDYQKGKDDFAKEIADSEKKLEDSKAELINGQRELESAKITYQDNLKNFKDKISAAEDELKANEEKLVSGQAEIDQGKKDLESGYKKLDEQFAGPRSELAKALEKLQATKDQLDAKKAEIDLLESSNENPEANENAPDDNQEPTKPSPEEIAAMKAQLEQGYQEYEKGLTDYEVKKNELENSYNSEKSKIDAAIAELDTKQKEIDQGFAKLTAGKEELTNNRISGQRSLDSAKTQIDQNQTKIDKGWTDYKAGLNKLSDEKAKGQRELEDAYQEILDGEEEYKANLSKFQNEKKNAQKDISDGEDQISDAKDTLARLVDPEYDIQTIRDNEGINTYYQNSLNMDELTKVFPTFFYLVAMLVTLTTMKRFIDEQRTINGTLKALGYSNKQISQRFYLYGIIPTFIGSIIGAIIGRFVVAEVIIKAYSSGFSNLGIDYVNALPYMIFAVILSSLLVALTVFLSSKETVKETPAALLLPKSPDPGKKIILEKIKPIWKRLSFLQKITSRNLFRYKSRMFMTLFGVGGCTALTFFGFAMIDSIKDTINLQKDMINHYNVIAVVDEKAKDSDLKSFNEKIKPYKSHPIRMEDIKLKAYDKTREASLVVANSTDDFDSFISLYDLKRNPIKLEGEEAVMTEKIANALKLKPGDTIKLSYRDKAYDFTISNIAENYTGNYIYMDKAKFEAITGGKLTTNASYLIGDADQIIEDIEDESAVNAIINSTVIYASIDVLMANLNLVIGVITLISVMLALVVLYNLININVSERKRELATIKVLGFYPKEVTSYIFREIFILTILGIIVGYFLGIAMFRYIISVVAPRDILLAYRVHFIPFLYSGLITIAISIALLLIVHNKLKKIDMAEAMSSGE